MSTLTVARTKVAAAYERLKIARAAGNSVMERRALSDAAVWTNVIALINAGRLREANTIIDNAIKSAALAGDVATKFVSKSATTGSDRFQLMLFAGFALLFLSRVR